jgi:hypothetical protein
VRSWCRELQVLKAFVWVNWVVRASSIVLQRFYLIHY